MGHRFSPLINHIVKSNLIDITQIIFNKQHPDSNDSDRNKRKTAAYWKSFGRFVYRFKQGAEEKELMLDRFDRRQTKCGTRRRRENPVEIKRRRQDGAESHGVFLCMM
ncbi:hypothetical protein [Neisseria sp. CCUG12390]|uniref:hypothetical protein n=1 Tax=Neisseria sp. CCUG12390 TaxID=3392035 RepID=UPI003A0FF141